jgi:c-di-GMP-binding flagellar brake protein YcgR
MAISMVEQRSSLRNPLELPVQLTHSGACKHVCCLKDLSLGGMFILCKALDDLLGKDIDIRLVLPSDTDDEKEYRLTVRVVRVTQDGVGVSFSRTDTTSFRTLQKLIKLNKKEH